MSPARRPAVISAVVVAAGSGSRMGGDLPKPYLDLGGLPILCRTLIRLHNHVQGLREIIVVVRPQDRGGPLKEWERHIIAAGATTLVDGGPTRQDSVEAGVMITAPESDLVLIHDAVRPFFPPAETREACRHALRVGGAVLAMPVHETLKREGTPGLVGETVLRTGLWTAQTPQVFRRDSIIAALRRARGLGLMATDDAQVVEAAGFPVALVRGSAWNLKITEPADLELAALLLAWEQQGEEEEG